MLLPLFRPSRIAWVVIAGFLSPRFLASTFAATNCPRVSLALAASAVCYAPSSMSGVVPSLLAMPLKLIGRGVLGAVVGWLMVAGRWLVGGLGFWTRLARCAARAAAVSSVAARVDARIRVTFMGVPPSRGSGRRGVPDHCGSSLRTDQAQRG